MGIIDLQIYNFLMVFIYNLQPFQTKNYIYNLQEIQENNCRFYNQYRAKSTIYKKSDPPLILSPVAAQSLTPTWTPPAA